MIASPQTFDPQHEPVVTLGAHEGFGGDPLGFLARLRAAHGEIFHYRVGPQDVIFVDDAETIGQIFARDGREFTKRQTPELMMLQPMLGNGLMTSDGEAWSHQRKSLQPSFQASLIESMHEAMAEQAQSFLAELPTEETIDLAESFTRLTTQILIACLFGNHIRVNLEAFCTAVSTMNRAMGEFRERGPSVLQEFEAARRQVLRVVAEIATEIRADQPLGPMGTLLREIAQDPPHPKYLEDQIMTFVMAGHETTAACLTWTTWLLTQHETFQDAVRAESSVGVRERHRTQHVIQESLRLYPPAWILSRTAKTSVALDRVTIPQNWLVVLSPFITHRHPAYWSDAEQFQPQRFEGSNERPAYAYWPFGGGGRHCIGRHFATSEMAIVLPQLLDAYDIQYTGENAPVPYAMVTLRPASGLPARLTRRPS